MTQHRKALEKKEKDTADHDADQLRENEFYDLDFCDNFEYFENEDMSRERGRLGRR